MSLPAPTEADIQRIVELVVAEVQPLRVVLFGSAARKELHNGSDVDLMVVVPEGIDTLRTAQRLHVAMFNLPDVAVRVSVDFVVTTPSRFEERRNSLGSVYREVARDGRELYAA